MKRKLLYTLGTVIAFAGVIKGCQSLIALESRLKEERNHEATKAYLELKEFADIDKSNTLSETERQLLYEQLDALNIYSDLPWRHIADRLDGRIERNEQIDWIPSEINRIYRAILQYEKDAEIYRK